MTFIIVQIMGVVIIIACAIMPHMKTKSALLLCNMVANFLQIICFWLLEALTGVSTVFATTLRVVVLFLYEKQGKRAPVWVLVGLVIVHIFAVAFLWAGWVSVFLLPPLVNVYGQWQDNLQITRYAAIITALGFGVYSFASGAYTIALNETLVVCSAGLAIWRYRKAT